MRCVSSHACAPRALSLCFCTEGLHVEQGILLESKKKKHRRKSRPGTRIFTSSETCTTRQRSWPTLPSPQHQDLPVLRHCFRSTATPKGPIFRAVRAIPTPVVGQGSSLFETRDAAACYSGRVILRHTVGLHRSGPSTMPLQQCVFYMNAFRAEIRGQTTNGTRVARSV